MSDLVSQSVRWYVCELEKTIISVCSRFGIEAATSPHTGVWVGDNKICAIGTTTQLLFFCSFPKLLVQVCLFVRSMFHITVITSQLINVSCSQFVRFHDLLLNCSLRLRSHNVSKTGRGNAPVILTQEFFHISLKPCFHQSAFSIETVVTHNYRT